jgi:cytidylate kinase
MGGSVITMATTIGSNAEQAARLVAERLGYRYVSDEIIDRAAEKVGVDRADVDAVEHSPPLVSRLMQVLVTLAVGDMPYNDAIPVGDSSPTYRALIQRVIREVAAEGKVVIVAHAASILLAGMPGLLRVLVTASPEKRISRLEAEPGVTRAEAERRVEHSDRERAAYLNRFYAIKSELPTHYDLVINTDVLTPAMAAGVIVAALAV